MFLILFIALTIMLEKNDLRILITGGSGLLAGRLAKFLSKHNNVTLLSRRNINNILESNSVYTINYQNQNDFNQDIMNHDIIIHASSPNAIDSKDINISKRYYEETKTLIDMASVSKNVKKFIFLSSIRVVSENLNGIITENTNVNPSSDYGKLKYLIENYLRDKYSENNMSKIVLRISNGYGHPVHYMSDCWNLVILDACRQAIKNKKIVLRTKGNDYKDFIPISTLTEVIGNIINDNQHQAFDIFNISSRKSVQIIEFLGLISEEFHNQLSMNIKIEPGEDRNKSDPNSFIIDNEKIANHGWLTPIDHKSEIENLIKFCFENKREFTN